MSDSLKPTSLDELRDAVSWALANEARLEVVARGTKRGLGRPMQVQRTLDVSALSGVRAYEPEELVLTAGAATPMAEIEALLAAKRQVLAFEPPDLGALMGTNGSGTLGGTIACNLAGPRRIKAGAARDHVLGFSAVSGRGEIFKAGGRVVKNVTGYDLSKLMAGSFGTLAVLADVTVKVLPAAEKSRTVLVFGLDDAAATAAMADALNSPCDVSGAAHLPVSVARRSACGYVRDSGRSVTAVRVEGTATSVAARTTALRELLGPRGPVEELHSMNSATLWREVRDVAVLLPDRSAAVWRVSLPPASGPNAVRAIASDVGAEHFNDWGGGLVWLAVDPRGDAGASAIRAQTAALGGHATLVRGPDALRAAVPVFEPQPDALAALSARVKDAFDPKRVLNPGRMYAGV